MKCIENKMVGRGLFGLLTASVIAMSVSVGYAQDRKSSRLDQGSTQVDNAVDGETNDETTVAGANVGFQPDNGAESLAALQLQARRHKLKTYLAEQRARLDIVTTTVTDSGQVIDWIPIESQSPDWVVASPPPLDDVEDGIEPEQQPVDFELDRQMHAVGPEGTVPVLRFDVDSVMNNIDPPDAIEDFLSKYGNVDDRGTLDLRASTRVAPDDSEAIDGLGNGPIRRRRVNDPGEEDEFASPGEAAHKYASTAQIVDNYGGQGSINLWDPYVWKSSEFSLGQVAVVADNIARTRQTVEAGWQDYKDLYGRTGPHFFIFYTTNGYASQGDNVGGYNRLVDGWVQVSRSIFPGARISVRSFSLLMGPQYTMRIRVQQYRGNWWIRVNNEWVGYYPGNLFSYTALRSGAEKISWYGEVVDLDDGITTYTDMGSGNLASTGYGKAAFMRNIKTFVSGVGSRDYNPSSSSSTPGCYTLNTNFGSGTSWGSFFYFGGPGKSSTCR